MVEEELIQQATEWLREHKCLNKFFRAAKKEGAWPSFSIALEMEQGNVICNSFTWSETPEGHNYWSRIHNAFYIWWIGED